MIVVPAIGLLLACQLVGEIAARGLDLPVPGPVIGLVLLFLGLLLFGRRAGLADEAVEESGLGRVCGGLLRELGVFFVPAGVGVVQYLGLVTQYGIGLALALAVSTVLTLIVTVWVFIGVARLMGRGRGTEGP